MDARALLGDAFIDIFAVAWEFRGLGRPRLSETCIASLVQRELALATLFAFYIAHDPYTTTLADHFFLSAALLTPLTLAFWR